MPATYEPIATVAGNGTAATITFSSIPATYTDLRLVIVCTTASVATVNIQFNSDTGTNYSQTTLYGTGSSALSFRVTSQAQISLTAAGNTSTTVPHLYTMDVLSYAGSTNKTALCTEAMDENGSGNVSNSVGLWRNTAAITQIDIKAGGVRYYLTGSTFTLYGIKKA